MKTFTVAERAELAEPAWEATRDTFPEYNNHGDVLNAYWGGLTEKYPEFQFHLVDDDEQILARARCASGALGRDARGSCRPGSTGRSSAAFDEGGANVLCAMVIQIPRACRAAVSAPPRWGRWRHRARHTDSSR